MKELAAAGSSDLISLSRESVNLSIPDDDLVHVLAYRVTYPHFF